jgi:hypothetical protein
MSCAGGQRQHRGGYRVSQAFLFHICLHSDRRRKRWRAIMQA